MLHPVHRRSLRLSRSSVIGNQLALDRPVRPITLDDVFAGVDERIADL